MATKTAKQYIYGVKEKQRLMDAKKRNFFIADAIQQDATCIGRRKANVYWNWKKNQLTLLLQYPYPYQ
jgi:hypothetical protein